MNANEKRLKTNKGLKEYTYLGCPLTLSKSAWCYRICTPDSKGNGNCGRLAPHTLKSYLQECIEDHKKNQVKVYY